MHPQDAADGWHMRKMKIKVKVPTDGSHRIQVFAGDSMVSDTPVHIIVCDHCSDEIPDGSAGVAVSVWQGQDEPENWERNYDTPQSSSPPPDQEAGS